MARSLRLSGTTHTATRPTGAFSALPREWDSRTRFGTIRLRIARAREKSFLPVGLKRFQRRTEEVSLLIREAFLRGISTQRVGRVVATITGRDGECADRVEADPRSGRGDPAVSLGAVPDYVYLFLHEDGH
jgi:hypothetical protein